MSVGIALSVGMLLHCGKDPTELEVEVLATDCATVTSTSVRTGSPGNVTLTEPAKATKSGCSGGRIGSVVLFPSGADDARVEIDVVTGFGKAADQCGPSLDGCIHARRITRFVPGTSTRVSMLMDPRCIGKPCPAGQTCSAGTCVSAEAGDGLAPPPADAAPESSTGEGGPTDPCEQCKAAGGTCNGGTCVINCTSAARCNTVTCPPGIPCEVNCSTPNACGDVTCAGPGCKIFCAGSTSGPGCGAVTCGGAGDCSITCQWCTGKVTCNAAKCDVRCAYICNDVEMNPTGTGSTAECLGVVDCNFRCGGEQCSTCQDGRYTCEPSRSDKCMRTGGC